MRSPNWLTCLGPLSLVFSLLGCDPGAMPNPNVTADAGALADTYFNLVHAVVDVDTVDLYVDKQRTVAALNYRKSSGNLKITPAAHMVELRTTGAPLTDPALLTATIDLLPGSKTLFLAVGRSAEAEGPSKLQLVAAPFGAPDAASVKVRLFNATPAAPPLDLAASSNVIATDAPFGSASGYGTVALLPAATKLGLRPTRTTADFAFVTLPAMATPGSVVTVIALGELSPVTDDQHFLTASVLDEGSGSLIDLPVVINDTGAKGSLYLVHASPDAPAVDVVDGTGTTLVSNLAYKQASALFALAPGPATVVLRATGTPATVLTVNLKILPAMTFTLVAQGSVALGTTAPLLMTGLPLPTGAQTSWRLVHTVADAPAFTVGAAGQPILTSVAYGHGSTIVAAALPSPTLGLRFTNQPTQGWDVSVPQTVLDASQGQLVTVVATGTVHNPMLPLTVLAVLDNTATPTMAATVIPLASMAAMTLEPLFSRRPPKASAAAR